MHLVSYCVLACVVFERVLKYKSYISEILMQRNV